MILPSQIKSRHKIRDAKIMSMVTAGIDDTKLLSQKFAISLERVNQIIRANARLVLENTEQERLWRINFIKRQLDREEVKKMSVSPDKWVDLLRKEYQSENAVTMTQNNINVYLPKREDEEIIDCTPNVIDHALQEDITTIPSDSEANNQE